MTSLPRKTGLRKRHTCAYIPPCATVAKNVPVECGGVTVRRGNIIVADEDGVVVVPQEHAAEVLERAQAIDQAENGMFPFIREFKSLSEPSRSSIASEAGAFRKDFP